MWLLEPEERRGLREASQLRDVADVLMAAPLEPHSVLTVADAAGRGCRLVTRILEHLHEAGWLTRTHDDTGRRLYRVTALGRRELAERLEMIDR